MLSIPLLTLLPPEDEGPLRSAAREIDRYGWVVFASPSAVEALAGAAREAGTLHHLRRSKVAVVGPATAGSARQCGLAVALEAATQTGTGLLEALARVLRPSEEVLLPAAQEGRRELQDGLEQLGFKVTRVAAYRSQGAALDAATVSALMASVPEAVLFGSPRTAEAFLRSCGEEGGKLLSSSSVVAIGPTTARALEELGIRVAAVADEPTSASLVDAVVRAVRG